MKEETSAGLSGIVPPMVSPLLGQNHLDIEGLERLVHHLVDGGVHGIFCLGTTGEGVGLTLELRKELVRRTCSQTRNSIPVLVSITDDVFEHSIDLAQHAAEAGARAVVVAPPFVMQACQEDLRHYLSALIEAQPLPLYLYHLPPLTKTVISLETLRWAVDQPRIVGIKDSSGDKRCFDAFLSAAVNRKDFSVFVGADVLMAEAVLAGGQGGVCGGANLFPELYSRVYGLAANRSPRQELTLLNSSIRAVVNTLFGSQNHPAEVIKVIKAGLQILGICTDTMALPFKGLEQARREEIRADINRLRTSISAALNNQRSGELVKDSR